MNIDLSKTQKHLEWLKTKLYLHAKSVRSSRRIVKRGEVYWCELGQGVGSEESKKRPCVILQADKANVKSPNTLVAPITHTSSELPVVIPVKERKNEDGEILLDGHALLGNIVCVSKGRLGDYIVKLDPDEMKEIDTAIAISTDIKRHYDKLDKILKDKEDYIIKLKDKISMLEKELEEQKTMDKSI